MFNNKLFLLVFIFIFLVGSVNALEYRFIKDEGEINFFERFLATSGFFAITETQCDNAVGVCDGDDLVYKCNFHEETASQLAWCECHLKYDTRCSGDECSSGETDCNGDLYYTCDNGQWEFEGNVNGKCGYSTPTCSTGSTKCEGIVSYNCENSQWIRKGQIIGKCGYTGLAVDPILTEVSHNIVGSLDGRLTGEYTLRNTGGDMTRYWILEQQVGQIGTGVQSVVAITQSTCNDATPENVHKTFNMDAGEVLTISLTSQVPSSKINILGFTEVHAIITEQCGSGNFKQPYLAGKYMGEYQVREESTPGAGKICCEIPVVFEGKPFRYEYRTPVECKGSVGNEVEDSKCEEAEVTFCEDAGISRCLGIQDRCFANFWDGKCQKSKPITFEVLDDIMDDEDMDKMWDSVCTKEGQCELREGFKVTCERNTEVLEFIEKRPGLKELFQDVLEWFGTLEKPDSYCKATQTELVCEVSSDCGSGEKCTDGECVPSGYCGFVEPLNLFGMKDECTGGSIVLGTGVVLLFLLFGRG